MVCIYSSLGKKYEDLHDLSIKELANYLSARSLNTYGRKVEPVAARAFPAFELKMNKLAGAAPQYLILKWSNNP